MQQANATMRRIGTELIEQRRAVVAAEISEKADNVKVKEKDANAIEGDKTTLDRDLLSVLSEFSSPLPFRLLPILSLTHALSMSSPLEHLGGAGSAHVAQRDPLPDLDLPRRGA